MNDVSTYVELEENAVPTFSLMEVEKADMPEVSSTAVENSYIRGFSCMELKKEDMAEASFQSCKQQVAIG